jgi:hypothetical protein
MVARIRLSPAYHEYAANRETVEVEGGTVRQCLDGLISIFPVFRQLLFDSEHSLCSLVIYRDDVILPDQLDRPVVDHHDISLLPMIEGG